MTALSAALFVARLAPELRTAIVALVKALVGGDEVEARRAFEAARRVAFEARQK